jgi:hypothetical protein
MSDTGRINQLEGQMRTLQREVTELRALVAARFGQVTTLSAPVVVVDEQGRGLIALGTNEHGGLISIRRADGRHLMDVRADDQGAILSLDGSDAASRVRLAATPRGGVIHLVSATGEEWVGSPALQGPADTEPGGG